MFYYVHFCFQKRKFLCDSLSQRWKLISQNFDNKKNTIKINCSLWIVAYFTLHLLVYLAFWENALDHKRWNIEVQFFACVRKMAFRSGYVWSHGILLLLKTKKYTIKIDSTLKIVELPTLHLLVYTGFWLNVLKTRRFIMVYSVSFTQKQFASNIYHYDISRSRI